MSFPAKEVARIAGIFWFVFIAYWAARAFNNKKTIYKDKGIGYAWLWRLAVGVVVWSAITGRAGGHALLFPYTKATQLIGLFLCGGGIGFAIWARTVLGRNWSGRVTLKENHELVTSGPYRFVRHPIYTGLISAFIGTVIAVIPSVYTVGLAVIGILSLWYKLRREEALMAQQFPEAYAEYKKRVPWAIVPYLI